MVTAYRSDCNRCGLSIWDVSLCWILVLQGAELFALEVAEQANGCLTWDIQRARPMQIKETCPMFEEIEPGKDVIEMVLGVSQCTRLYLCEAHPQPLPCYPWVTAWAWQTSPWPPRGRRGNTFSSSMAQVYVFRPCPWSQCQPHCSRSLQLPVCKGTEQAVCGQGETAPGKSSLFKYSAQI